ncbi:hypothetical protein BH23CHL1_BH23CHL1_16390 [soil metagenome]
MFVDLTFFEVGEGRAERFEAVYGAIIHNARDAQGCISSDLVRLTEVNRYCWVERWVDRDAHQRFNEFLFGDIIPGLPDDLNDIVTRLDNRDADGVSVSIPGDAL